MTHDAELTWSDDWIVEGEASAPTLILAHGAGAPMDTPFMDAIAAAVVAAGGRVVRFEFPYMHQRRVDGKRRGPNTARVLEETWRGVFAAVRASTEAPIVIGGKSMGGRVASMIADDLGAAGLVCLGYPFHPPGKPEKTRTAHLGDLRTPALILQGTRDTFGKPEEVAAYALASTIDVRWIEDGDHSFKPRKRSGRTLEENLDEAGALTAAFVLAQAGAEA